MRRRKVRNSKEGKSRKKQGKPLTFGGVSARIVMLVLAGLQFVSFMSMVVNPAKAWIFNIFGLMFLPLFVVNLFLFLWALKRRSRSCVIPLVALFPSVFFIGGYFRFPGNGRQENAVPDADRIKVVSYNVGRFMQADERKISGGRRACTDSVMNFLEDQDADIICLQEFYTTDVGRVKSFLSRWMKDYRAEYYFYRSRYGYYGNVTLSRMKAEGKGVVKFDDSANLALYTDYSLGGRVCRVYNCHFESYNISLSGLLRSVSGRGREVFRETEYKMRRGITMRPRQVDLVLKHISDSPVEAFVCGDFNDTPMSYTYYRLSRGRNDSFRKAGEWFGATFSLLWPLLRIDYVLYPKTFRAVSHETPRCPYSDHYPVIAEVCLKELRKDVKR